jgi:hypothetical protein
MFDPFEPPRNLTPEQWRARGRAIEARLHDWSVDELLRGRRDGEPPDLGVRGLPRHGYDPNQPRVPKGHPDGGQWTDDNRSTDHALAGARFAAAERPPFGPRTRIGILLQVTRRLIDAFRSEHGDLFGGHQQGTVAVTTIDGKEIYGTNSNFGDWHPIDHTEAGKLRAVLVRKHPTWASGRNLGRMPLNALYHAETNALLRAARANGGSLAGRVLEVVVDRPMCDSCKKMLPYVGLELGNPTVTFVEPNGTTRVMRDGRWID